MASGNPFELLIDDDSEDPSQLISAQLKKTETKKTVSSSAKAAQPQAKLPSKPLAPTQAVRGARGGRGGGRWNGRGRGAGGNNGNYYGNREVSGGRNTPGNADSGRPFERHGGNDVSRGPSRGGHRGGYSNGYGNHDQSPKYSERDNGTGGDFEQGGNAGNWETPTDEPAKVAGEVVSEGEKNLNLNAEKHASKKNAFADEEAATKRAQREADRLEDAKKITLAQYEKILEEKKKALQAPRQTDERRIEDKDFATMKKISTKKTDDEILAKLASDKEKKKQSLEKEEKAKKSVSINEWYYGGSGRGRGSDHRAQGGQRGGNANGDSFKEVRAPRVNVKPIAIEDPGQFPTLGGK